jgi:hypothetical protein
LTPSQGISFAAEDFPLACWMYESMVCPIIALLS